MSEPTTLYAAGLGLVIYSGGDTGLADGLDHLPHGEPSEQLAGAMSAHRVVLLGTGSPQLDYIVTSETGTPPSAGAEHVEVVFYLDVTGEFVIVRDGYDLMEWTAASDNAIRLAVPSGAVRVLARTSRSIEKVQRVFLYVSRCSRVDLQGDGWAYLELSVRQR